jgi:hypothetical protein
MMVPTTTAVAWLAPRSRTRSGAAVVVAISDGIGGEYTRKKARTAEIAEFYE